MKSNILKSVSKRIVIAGAGAALLVSSALAFASISKTVKAGEEENFSCNVFGDTTLELSNNSDLPVKYHLRWAMDQNQNRDGTLAPHTATHEVVGCGGVGTPGVWLRNLSNTSLETTSH